MYGSRLATGAATGVLVSAAAPWLQELSREAGPGVGASRAVYATGAGFALGPVATGAMAEWLPYPEVLACLVHGGLALAVLAATARVPETAPARGLASRQATSQDDSWSAVTHPRFVGVVLPASPAIFAAVTVAFVVLPPLVVARVRDVAPLFTGLVAAVTISVGLVVQPVAARIDRPGSARATVVAMATVVVGLLVSAFAMDQVSPVLVVVAAVVLGTGYGLTLESGLSEIRRLASPSTLPTASALFQGVAHSGFLTPLLLAVTAGTVSYPALLAGLAVVGLLLLAFAATYSRLHGSAEPPGQPHPGRRSRVDSEEARRAWAEWPREHHIGELGGVGEEDVLHTTRCSGPVSRRITAAESTSDCTGFSPMTSRWVSSPSYIASIIWERCMPRFGGSLTRHRRSNFARASSSSTS